VSGKFSVPEHMRCKATVTNKRSKNLGRQCPNHRQRNRETDGYYDFCAAHRGVPQRAARLDADKFVESAVALPEEDGKLLQRYKQAELREERARALEKHHAALDAAKPVEIPRRALSDGSAHADEAAHEWALSEHETDGMHAEADLVRKLKANDETRESWRWTRRGDYAPLPYPEVEGVDPGLARLFGVELTEPRQRELNERAVIMGDEIPFPGIERRERRRQRGPRRLRGSQHPLEGRIA